MNENTRKRIKERFDALPESIQEIILSSHYQDTLIEIGKQYQLNVEQLGILERETTLVMMGLTPTKDFEADLIRELNIDETKGTQITKDINEKIFLKIRELLKLMNTPPGENPIVEEEVEEKQDNSVLANKEGDTILNQAGIKIIRPARNATFGVAGGPARSVSQSDAGEPAYNTPSANRNNFAGMVANTSKPKINAMELKKGGTKIDLKIKPILEQKLSGLVKASIVKTDHSVENITSSTNTEKGNKKTYPPKTDPYRLDPEE